LAATLGVPCCMAVTEQCQQNSSSDVALAIKNY
jgi:hypothetical protein